MPVAGISKYGQSTEYESIHVMHVARVQVNGWQTCTRVSLRASLHRCVDWIRVKSALNCNYAHPGTKPGWAWYFVKKIIFI